MAFTEHENLGIVLADGTRLSARAWLPEGDEPVPAILEYLPYRKRDGTVERDSLTHPWFAERGYACLRVDMRGNGDSEGLLFDEYTETELSDCEAVIDWIAMQPWCTGAVGMMGISWGGFNSLQVAARQPAALKAIITLCSTVDRFADDIHYKGGCLLNENLGWSATMFSYSSRPPDPALVGDAWRDMWLDRLRNLPMLAGVWLEHATRDSYWQHGSVCENFSAIQAATLAVGGWGDAYVNAIPALVDNLHAPVKGITGPWVHKYPHFAAPEPRIGFLQEALRWWDRYLKGEQNGVDDLPDWRGYVLDSSPPKAWYSARPGRWVGVDKSSEIPLTVLHATAAGGLDAVATDNNLDHPVATPAIGGLHSGEFCAIWLGPEMPDDQRADDALARCYDSDALDAPLAVVGRPRVRLRLRSDKPLAQIAVRLCDLQPDGASSRVSYGVLNLCQRDSHAAHLPLPVDESVDVLVELNHCALEFAPGNRVRVAVSTDYWPLLWPMPEPVNLTVEALALELPGLAPDHVQDVQFDEPDQAEPWQHEVLREPAHQRRVEHDLISESVTLVIEDDFGEMRDRTHGLAKGSVGRERWSIN
ncbi:MAG: CocE/NonD family hydrolase, partial [Pseudomonadota bacterium]